MGNFEETFKVVMTVLGGLGIFLFGIKYMGDALKLIAGDKLKDLIERFTSNQYKGALVGLFTTVLIQSSSGTTALTISLVRAGIMSLTQAIGIIMGANIGTTVTAFLIGLKLADYALLFIIVGAVPIMFAQKKKNIYLGQIIFGFGCLFFGIEIMQGPLKDIAELKFVQDAMVTLSHNPFLAVLAGAFFTVIIQSSSASIGIVQTLYATGAIPFAAAVPLVLGDNIGTTITAVLASLGGSTAAKRAATVHVLFNVIGTAIYLFLIIFLNYTNVMHNLFTEVFHVNEQMQLAYVHMMFNVSVTLLLLPFAKVLERIATKIISNAGSELDIDETLLSDQLIYQSSALAVEQAQFATAKMGELGIKGLHYLEEYIETSDVKTKDKLIVAESMTDLLDEKIRAFLVKLIREDLSKADSKKVEMLIQTIKDYERMSDHILNIVEILDAVKQSKQVITDELRAEIKAMLVLSLEAIDATLNIVKYSSQEDAIKVIEIEAKFTKLEKKLRLRHIKRINEDLCTGVLSAVYLDLIHNFERICDHCENIAGYIGDAHDEGFANDLEKIINEL